MLYIYLCYIYIYILKLLDAHMEQKKQAVHMKQQKHMKKIKSHYFGHNLGLLWTMQLCSLM